MEEKLFTGFENENRYRSYPFSETASLEDQNGVPLAQDVFIDAILYPVNSAGIIRMTKLDCAEKTIEFSDDNGVVAVGSMSKNMTAIWVYDVADFEDHTCGKIKATGRPVGRIACGPGFKRELSTGRTHLYEKAIMAPSSVCPITYSGVKSITVEGNITTALPCLKDKNPSNIRLEDRKVGILGEGRLVAREELSNGKTYMWFDVLQDYSDHSDVEVYKETTLKAEEHKEPTAISTLIVAVEGKSLFDISCIGSDDAIITMETLDREDICYQANKEAVSSKARIDVCPDVGGDGDGMSCNPDEGEGPSEKHKECVFTEAADVGLLTPDFANYKNPVWIGSAYGDSGENHPQYPQITDDMSIEEATREIQKLHGNPTVSNGGLEIAVPGAGGMG